MRIEPRVVRRALPLASSTVARRFIPLRATFPFGRHSRTLAHADGISPVAYDPAMEAAEARALAHRKAQEVSALPWDELDRYGEKVEEVELPTGKKARVKICAFWDMDDWESDMNVIVKVYAPRGCRRYWPWKAARVRGGETLPTQRPA